MKQKSLTFHIITLFIIILLSNSLIGLADGQSTLIQKPIKSIVIALVFSIIGGVVEFYFFKKLNKKK